MITRISPAINNSVNFSGKKNNEKTYTYHSSGPDGGYKKVVVNKDGRVRTTQQNHKSQHHHINPKVAAAASLLLLTAAMAAYGLSAGDNNKEQPVDGQIIPPNSISENQEGQVNYDELLDFAMLPPGGLESSRALGPDLPMEKPIFPDEILSVAGEMRASDVCRNLIKDAEGFRAEAYKCSADKWTIGWGHTLDVKAGDSVTKDEAEKLLDADIEYFEDIVNQYVKVPFTQGQFDALVSFIFNVGEGNFKNSDLLGYLNQEQYENASEEFNKWVYAKNKEGTYEVLPGLKTRRARETEVFNS